MSTSKRRRKLIRSTTWLTSREEMSMMTVLRFTKETTLLRNISSQEGKTAQRSKSSWTMASTLPMTNPTTPMMNQTFLLTTKSTIQIWPTSSHTKSSKDNWIRTNMFLKAFKTTQ